MTIFSEIDTFELKTICEKANTIRRNMEFLIKLEQGTNSMDERWLTVDDICKYLNVSNETVYKWIEQRVMPGHRVGSHWMFKQDKVHEWVRPGGAADKSDKPNTEQ